MSADAQSRVFAGLDSQPETRHPCRMIGKHFTAKRPLFCLILMSAFIGLAYWLVLWAQERRDQSELQKAAKACSVPVRDIYWYGGSTRYARLIMSVNRSIAQDKIQGYHACLLQWAIKSKADYTSNELTGVVKL